MSWLTVAEAARLAKLSAWTIYAACDSGEIAHTRINGRRSIRLTPESLEAWMQRHERPARTQALAG